jgi:hypothetical protein
VPKSFPAHVGYFFTSLFSLFLLPIPTRARQGLKALPQQMPDDANHSVDGAFQGMIL